MTVDASLAVSLDTPAHPVRDELDRQTAAAFPRHAAWLSRSATAVAAAGVTTVLDLGAAPAGRFWEITGVVVVGTDDHTVISGTTVAFYIGQPSQAPLSDLILPGSQAGSAVTVPANSQWGRRQLLALSRQHPYVLVTGAPAGQNLTAVLFGWDRDLTELPIK